MAGVESSGIDCWQINILQIRFDFKRTLISNQVFNDQHAVNDIGDHENNHQNSLDRLLF